MLALGIISAALGVAGVIGSIVPGLPGPPVSWAGMLLAYLAHGTDADGAPMNLIVLLVFLVVTIAVTILDYVVPAGFTKMTGGSKAASRGAVAGLIAGLLVPPVGMIVGSLIGAFLCEFLFADKGIWGSAKASAGVFLGFLGGTAMKLVCSGVMMYYIVVYGF